MNKNLIEALRLIVLKDSEDLINRYETELFSADEKRKAEKKKFDEEIAPQIKELKAEVKDISSQIGKAPLGEKAKLGLKIKSLNESISSLQQPVTNHFTALETDTKGYACSIFLLKEMIKEEALNKYEIPLEIDEKGKISVDYETLKSSDLGSKILETSDYITDRIRALGTKITNPSDIKNVIKSDYTNYFIGKIEKEDTEKEKERKNNEYENIQINFETILKCKTKYDEDLARIANQNKTLEAKIAESKKGIKVLKEYPSGNVIVELLPSEYRDEDGKTHHSSITFESDEMGHCIGRGSYDNLIGTKGYNFYSLRSYNKDGVFEPHCTISIENDKLRQIKGNSNLSVKAKYVMDVRDFVKSLNKDIPASEKALIGYIKDTKNNDIDLYNLKGDTRLSRLNYASGDDKYIDLKKIAYIGNIIFDDIPSLTDFKSLKSVNEIGSLNISSLKTNKNIKKVLDLYSIDDLPYTRNGITSIDWSDAKGLSTKEVLTKMHGTAWAEEYLSEQDGKLVIGTDINLIKLNITNLDLKNVVINGKLTVDVTDIDLKDTVVNGELKIHIVYPVENLPKYEKLSLIGNIRENDYNLNYINKLKPSKYGVDFANWGDVSSLPYKDVLKKLKGTDWTEKHMSEENGRTIINCDLDMTEHGIFDLSKDFKHVLIKGKFKTIGFDYDIIPETELGTETGNQKYHLNTNHYKEVLKKFKGNKWVDENMFEENGRTIINCDLDIAEHGIVSLPDDFKHVLIKGKLKTPKFNYDLIPETELGVETETHQYYLSKYPLKDVLKKFKGTKWADENIVMEDGKVKRIRGDLDLSKFHIVSLNEEINSIIIDGEFNVGYGLSLEQYPNCKTLNLADINPVKSKDLPDSVEKILFSNVSALSLRGKNLKEVEVLDKEGVQINPEDMLNLSPDIKYKGKFIAVNHAHYGQARDMNVTCEHVDISKIRIEGEFLIGIDTRSLKWCPNADFINAHRHKSITSKSLEDLGPDVKVFDATDTNIYSLEYLPENSSLKEFRKTNYDENKFLNNITKYNILYDLEVSIEKILSKIGDGDSYLDSGKDYSEIKLKTLEIGCKIDSFEKIPQVKSLSIRDTYGNPNLLKDLPAFTEELNLNYEGDIDFSAINPESRLKKIALRNINTTNKDYLQNLPKTIEKIEIIDGCLLNLNKISDLPNLKEIKITGSEYLENAIDKISPEKLKHIKFDTQHSNKGLISRYQEIVTIYDAPSNEINDKLKQINKWLCKDDNKRIYLHRQMAFYKLGSDIIDGKYSGEINDKILNKSADKFEGTMLRSCSEIIMANEINNKEGNETSGRKVIDMLKNKKAGYYKNEGSYRKTKLYLIKAIITRSIKKHPDFEKTSQDVDKRMEMFKTKMQVNFNEKFNEKCEKIDNHIAIYNIKNTSLNKYVIEASKYLKKSR